MSHFLHKCSCGAIIAQCRCGGQKEVKIFEKACRKCQAVEETTSTASVGNGAPDGPPLNLMPFAKKGKTPKSKLRRTHGDWKTLTVSAHPWKKAEGDSGYELANAYLQTESIDFFDGHMEEAVAIAAQNAMLSKKYFWDWREAKAVIDLAESIFEAWKERTIKALAEKAVIFLNERMEIVVREAYSLTEGLDSEFNLVLVPALKLEEGELYLNPHYDFVYQALEGVDTASSALRKVFALFDPPEDQNLVMEEEECAVDKISEHLRALL